MKIERIAKLPAVSMLDSEYYGFGEDDADYNYTLLGALPTIVFYNCLGEQLEIARDYLITQKKKIKDGGYSVNTTRPDKLCGFDSKSNSTEEFSQFEIFWMLLVLMFGDYGTSPRYGWINYEQIDDAILFIDWLLKGEKES